MPIASALPSRAAGELIHTLADKWWLFMIKGIAAIVFGILAFAWPGATLVTLILLYAAFALVDGILALIAAITGRSSAMPRWWLAVIGVLGIAAGIVAFAWPGMTALLLLLFIAGWAVATGVFQIIGAIQLRKEIDNEWTLILGGVLSILIGIGMAVMPGAGALALIWVIGAYAILFGILTLAFALRLRRHRHHPLPSGAAEA